MQDAQRARVGAARRGLAAHVRPAPAGVHGRHAHAALLERGAEQRAAAVERGLARAVRGRRARAARILEKGQRLDVLRTAVFSCQVWVGALKLAVRAHVDRAAE
jgi:hypothetical protein